MNVRDIKSVKARRKLFGNLPHIGCYSLDESVASSRNCENMIGVAQVPMGIAGPLRIKNREYYIPLATTEGALVASVNRGCKAITESGGASVLAVRKGATRGPVFKVNSLEENSALFRFIESNKNDFDRIAKTTSSHIQLLDVYTNSVGLYRFVRFVFDTQDAMGLNMATIATDKIVRFIEEKTGAQCTSLSGNYCVDKKASWLNMTHGRGFEVWAEANIPYALVDSFLHTNPDVLCETWMSKCMIGSAMSGSMGFNAQYANVLAALFIASGQDPAHVAECSIGITIVEKRADALYVSIYLPDLMVGIVGGGTSLATQKEALSIIGAKTSQELAEVVGSAVLAGEISLLSSLAEGTLAKAHNVLARGRV